MIEIQNHIGVDVFRLLKPVDCMLQSELVSELEQIGHKRYKVNIYLKYVLIFPWLLGKNKEMLPMIEKFIQLDARVYVKLNKHWRETDEDAVVALFDNFDFDNASSVI